MASQDKDQGKINPPAGDKPGQPSRRYAMLKAKINGWLINYFNVLVLALAVIIFALGLALFVVPEYSKFAKANEQAKKNLQIEFEAKNNYLSSIRSLKKSDRLISSADKEKIAEMVPAGEDISEIITEMESIILKNGAILNSIKLDSRDSGHKSILAAGEGGKKQLPAGIFEQLPAGVSRVKIEISLGSVSYPILKNIIKTLENNLRLFDVAQIDFSARENKARLGIYSYYLTP